MRCRQEGGTPLAGFADGSIGWDSEEGDAAENVR